MDTRDRPSTIARQMFYDFRQKLERRGWIRAFYRFSELVERGVPLISFFVEERDPGQ